MNIKIHDSADVPSDVKIEENTAIWHQVQIRPGAIIGANCVIGKGVYIDTAVKIGANVKIQNYACIYQGVTLEDGVFVGPHVCFTNDLRPRAINKDGSIKSEADWTLTSTLVKKGASLGANSTIRCGITIGKWAMVGAGSVVTKDVPDYALVWGTPARLQGFVCPCGETLIQVTGSGNINRWQCPLCHENIQISSS